MDRCERKLIVPVLSFLLIIGFLVQFPSILVNYCRFYHSQTLMKDKVDITWSIKNSPIVGQWSMLHSILVIPGHKKVEMFHKGRNFRNSEEVLKHDITMNSIDLWYVYLYLFLKHK
ncbi:hypothetical protein KAX75_01875 [candidate division WOR-3 bacterium]|nr:hypothetical protein [candidate division WOR-3 bacterium]